MNCLIQGLAPTESAVVWSEVSRGIMNKDWERAGEAKRRLEERERALARERKEKGQVWTPRHFAVSQDKEGQWECYPLRSNEWVLPAPIVVPSQSSHFS